MAKQSGLGDQLFIGGYDIGADTASIGTISTPRATLPSTGITSFANERIFGQRDASAEFTTYFNPGPVGGPVGGEHLALRGLPTADTQVMYLRGSGLGNDSFSMVAKQLNYDAQRGNDGALTFGVSTQSNGFGADWGYQVTPGKRSDTTATNGASLDLLVGSTSFGFQAYLQVFSFTGTSITIKLQESSDNAVGDPFADIVGGAFTAVTAAPTFQRIQSASDTLTVERYVRVVTTGTFSQCSFAVTFTRNEAQRIL